MLEIRDFRYVGSRTGPCLMQILYIDIVEVQEHRLRIHVSLIKKQEINQMNGLNNQDS